jgi:hypothetical protein
VQLLLGSMGTQWHRIRNGLICALIVAACLWATYPVVQMGVGDDWSYIKTAQLFAHTGHFFYDGWTVEILGWQVVWSALFIKLFGFSFTVVRLSILPVAMATVFLFHAILLRFGVNPQNAALGTLTLGLSPLFVPLATTYLTDVPGLFVILLCIYFCQRVVAAASSRTTLMWLCLAAGSNVAGGTARQVAWLGALVIVPSAGWMLRRRRGVLLTSSLLWVFSVAAIFACMRWFARQPYSIPGPAPKGAHFSPIFLTIRSIIEVIGGTLCLLLLLYPILVGWLPKIRALDRAALLRIASITAIWGLFQWATKWTLPWLTTVLRSEFAAERTGTLRPTPLFLPMWALEAVSLLVIATALTLVEQCSIWSRLENKTVRELWFVTKNELGRASSRQDILWLLGPYSVCYFLLLVSGAYHLVFFDRYLLFVMPVAIVCLLKLYQARIAATLPVISVIVLAIFAILAIGGTHDLFAWHRAELAALDEIRASGVPRTEIQGGYEYDGWTQIEASGYINDPRLKVPAGAYHPYTRPQALPDDCRFEFTPYTPAIQPKFSTIFPKTWCLAPSKFPPVSYRTWLPPFKGTIYIQEIPDHSG